MRMYKLVVAASCVAVAGCWTEGDDETAQNVEAAFENTAEQYDQAAKNASGAEEERLEDTAKVYREAGEAAAEAVDETDLQGNVQ